MLGAIVWWLGFGQINTHEIEYSHCHQVESIALSKIHACLFVTYMLHLICVDH